MCSHKANRHKRYSGLTWQHQSRGIFSVHSSNEIQSLSSCWRLRKWPSFWAAEEPPEHEEMSERRWWEYETLARSTRFKRRPLKTTWEAKWREKTSSTPSSNGERKLAARQEVIKQQNTFRSRKATCMTPSVTPLYSTGRGEDIVLETLVRSSFPGS